VISIAHIIGLALAVALVAGGAVTAFASSNALKKTAAVVTALAGALLALALLGAPSVALVAAVAVAFAYCVVGVAISVRLQEAYGSVETGDVDAADEQDEPRGPET
jgi:hypothetical protein